MRTANSIKKELWMNVPLASGEEITVDRRYLLYLITELERDQYGQGWNEGYQCGLKTKDNDNPIDNEYVDMKIEW